MIKNKILSPIDQWLGVNREIKLYKLGILFLVLIVLVQIIAGLFSQNKAPIVVTAQGSNREYQTGKRDLKAPSQDDVRAFLKSFIELRYRLHSDHLPTTLKNIAPLSTEGYLTALKSEIDKDLANNKGQIKSFEQYVAKIEVIVNEKEALARFDKIVRLNGLPLIVPTEASFQIIKDTSSKWNPYGILVNGVIEHESK
jgi:hypothetical protein